MKYNRIKKNDVVNGVGIMVSVWTQGCPHHCNGCFNTETWSFNCGEDWTEEKNKEVLTYLDMQGVKRNLAILGGEPLCPENIDGVLGLCKYIKQHRPETTIYIWSGYTFEELAVMYDYSLFEFDVLIDGKFEKDLADITLKLRGSANQRIIDVQETIKNKEIKFYNKGE